MCIVYLSIARHPEWPLFIAANRDEFHRRPTAAAAPWDGNPDIISGLDLSGGGTWLGINRSGHFGILTNYRDPAALLPHAPTRGLLVGDFLDGTLDAQDYADQVWSSGSKYNGFNLIVGDTRHIVYTGNRQAAGPRTLGPGSYILSNHLLDTPWPKAERLRTGLDALALGGNKAALEQVFTLLRDTTPAPDDMLPDTGIPLERERLLSSPFIISDTYGTRCSTIVAVRADRSAIFCEVTYDPQGREIGRRDWNYTMKAPLGY